MKVFIVFWWIGGQRKPGSDGSNGTIDWLVPPSPHGAIFTDEESAKAASIVRNAMMITVDNRSSKMPDIQGADWYRRDDAGNPMPVAWRELLGGGPGPHYLSKVRPMVKMRP